MGDVRFQVVPADMDADATQWGAASEALGRAHKAVPALGVSFGGFQSVVGAKYSAADLAVQNMLEVGESRLRATSTNVTSNTSRTKDSDKDADTRVRTAGGGGGGGGGAGAGGDGGASGADQGGKGKSHYAELMGTGTPMPTDPKDPEITFDRTVDPETGEVSWTPRHMGTGESRALDGRDVERIPTRADRIVVTMVDGEPQITYVDKDGDAGRPGVHWQSEGGRPVASAQLVEPGGVSEARVVAGSGAVEPQPELPRTQWSRALPEGADFAVVEVRDGEPHLVFLDVEGREVTQVSDSALPTSPVRAEANGVSR